MLLGKRQRLAHGQIGHAHENLIHQFGELPRAAGAAVGDGLPRALKSGSTRSNAACVAADHDRERPVLRPRRRRR